MFSNFARKQGTLSLEINFTVMDIISPHQYLFVDSICKVSLLRRSWYNLSNLKFLIINNVPSFVLPKDRLANSSTVRIT